MIDKPAKVPQKEITSTDVVNFANGLNLNGAQMADANSFIASQNVELTPDGFITNRRVLNPFLPNTVDTVYQIYPVIWNGVVYYVTADAESVGSTSGRIVYCKEGDTSWTVAGAVEGSTNSVTVNNGGKPEFLRVLDTVMILNGENGDKLAYLNIATWEVEQYTPIADPTADMTATASGGITGATSSGAANVYPIYYAFSYTTATGETNLSPILTYWVSATRDQWQSQLSGSTADPGKLTLDFNDTPPTGAEFRNLYVALAASGGTIQADDMLSLATEIPLNQAAFVDDGSLSVNLGQPSPTENSTDGPRVSHGITEEGNPILFGDVDTPQNIWIGGGGQNALSFSTAMGGYKAQPNLGTNFTVSAIIGFRNGQGVPSLTVLFSNTQGLAEQAVLEQQTVTYGSETFTVWGVTSQHYGAAGVAAPDSAINYNGKLLFMSTDGLMSMNTQPLRQNVISTDNLSIKTINAYVSKILNSAMNTIVGTAWDNRYMWLMPNDGFSTPQQILVMDDNNPVQQNNNNGAFYTMDIPGQWIDVVSPTNEGAFIYIVQGNKSYKLQAGTATFDIIDGSPKPFATGATGPLIGMGGSAHNQWQADVQCMFYVVGLVGSITVGVNYRDQNNNIQTRSTTYNGPSYIPTKGGGWGDTQYTYADFPIITGYAESAKINTSAVALTPVDARIAVQTDDVMVEGQWWFQTNVGYNAYKIRAISFEGINLGVRPDLQ